MNFLLQVELQFTRDAIVAIAEKALGRKTGARGLRAILEHLLLDAMFDAPGSAITAVRIDKDVVAEKKGPMYFKDVPPQQEQPTSSFDTCSPRQDATATDLPPAVRPTDWNRKNPRST